MQKKIFLCIKRSSLPSPNLPNSPNSPNLLNTRQICRSESQKFAQYSPNSRVTKIWRIFGEYSNSTNLPASCHCLVETNFLKCQDFLDSWDQLFFFSWSRFLKSRLFNWDLATLRFSLRLSFFDCRDLLSASVEIESLDRDTIETNRDPQA